MRRAVGFAFGAILLFALLVVLLGWLLGAVLGQHVLGAVFPVIGLVLLLLFAARLVRSVRGTARPIGEIIEAAGRVEAGEVGTQVTERGPREVRALARSFNAMSRRLAGDASQRRLLLADVSHELRTPLTVIQGTAEGMLDGLYPADRAHLERILAEARQLERLVEDLRTLALADAGALPLHREPTDVRLLVREVVAGLSAGADEVGVALSAETDGADGREIEADPVRIRQVIGNLVANALRHTERGGRVTVSVATPTASGTTLTVSDTGRGMDAEAATHAFDRFWRQGEGAGAGLGLAIVRDLVTAHGGTVSLLSEPGVGTTVRVELP
jgi:two-component system sensor histidine kinase BaeS